MLRNFVTAVLNVLVLLSVASCGGSSTDTGSQPVPGELVAKPGISAPGTGRASSSLPAAFSDPTPEDQQSWALIAGQTIDAGQVNFWNDADNLYVEFNGANGWDICAVHVYFGTSKPNAKGNPGSFPYQASYDPPTADPPALVIPLNDLAAKTSFYLALHAEVCQGEQTETGWGGQYVNGAPSWEYSWSKKWGGYGDMCLAPFPALPATPQTYTAGHYGVESYWDIDFTPEPSPALPLGAQGNGNYHGWCVDLLHSMYPGWQYNVMLYSTYDPALPTHASLAITTNGNWDFINYMINQRHNPTAGGPFAGVDWTAQASKDAFESAVWYFANNNPVSSPLAEAFAEDAIANGDNYIPCDGEWYGIALYPDVSTDNNQIRAQFNVIEVDP